MKRMFYIVAASIMVYCIAPNQAECQWVRVGGEGLRWSGFKSGGFLLDTAGKYLFTATDVGLFRSGDNGEHWIEIHNGIEKYHTTVSFYFASMGAKVFLGVSEPEVDSPGCFYSDDYGLQWRHLDIPFPRSSRIRVYKDNLFLFSDSVYLSKDGGLTWSTIENIAFGHMARCAAIDADLFWIDCASPNVFKSTFDFTTWSTVNTGLPVVDFGFEQLFEVDRNLYVTAEPYGIYRSPDKGAHWISANAGIDSFWVSDFATYGNDIFMAAYNERVFVSTDSGAHWSDVSSGLPKAMFYKLAVNNGYLFLGTSLTSSTDSGAPIYRRPLQEMVQASIQMFYAKKHSHGEMIDLAISNSHGCTIRYGVPEAGFVSMDIFDVSGRAVLTLVNQNEIPGAHEVSLNERRISPGPHIIRVKYKGREFTRCFTTIR
jgi:hypothetical protein